MLSYLSFSFKKFMPSLFDSLDLFQPPVSDWKIVPPPDLRGTNEIYLNFETTGLRWFDKDIPIGASLATPDGQTWYLPWRHRGDSNFSEPLIKEYFKRVVRNKHIVNLNTRSDLHMARVWGVDFEAQGCTVSDVGHYAALLDDHRYHYNLDSLIQDYLHEQPMARVDESRMVEYYASEVAARSMYSVQAVRRLKEVFWPMLEAEDLHQVRQLEDSVIYVVCEMEKNGFPIDFELLDRWIQESQTRLNIMLWDIAKLVGFQCNPDSPKDQERVFHQLQIPLEYTMKGAPSFTDAVLARIDHPTIKLMRRAGKFTSLRNKFIVASKKYIDNKGILRYALHQLRTTKDEGGEAGAVTGRFSSGELAPGFGVNIQQRSKPAKQRASFGFDENDTSHDDEIFLVRKLHVPQKNMQLLASDMDQAQYRIFAHYVNNPRIIQAYQDNPKMSFHRFMHDLLRPYANLTYGHQKDLNFAYIFGAGLTKMALMMGHITLAQFEQIRNLKDYSSPLLNRTKEVKRLYERELPEVVDLLAEASHLAKPECDSFCKPGNRLHRMLQHRGYVRTILGRRGRFPDGQRLHKAFNMVDQGSEADLMKTKLVELHKTRKETGLILRVTNHDEVVGDIQDREHALLVDKLLNEQSIPFRVPMTWETSMGPNWAELNAL